ncbi:zinc ribbon domain-containing protein [candidate division WOR-3 bacterium]|nr:zinc ribbon domain-containing protein [candidate division WOR-3 bacterium]
MVSFCPQCGGKLSLRTSPQVLSCPFCGSSVEVEALSSQVWTLNPVIEKKAAWEIAVSCIGEVKFIKGYLVPFSSPPMSLPLNKKAPRGLKISYGEKIYGDNLEGFTSLNSESQPFALIPYWFAKSANSTVWISASDGSRIVETTEAKTKKIFFLESAALAASLVAGILLKFSVFLSLPVFSAIALFFAVARPGKK